MKIKASDIFAILFLAAVAVWVGASWYEIAANNGAPGFVCSAWNVFELLF